MPLDPVTARRERESEAAKKAVPPQLDPEFPYRRQPFDPFFFGLEREPTPPPARLTGPPPE